MEALDFKNILGEKEIDTLFSEPETTKTHDSSDDAKLSSEEVDSENDTLETTETDNLSLFEDSEMQSEGVGSADTEGSGEGTSTTSGGTSPKNNFYSSIANAMAVDGIFPNLNDDVLNKVTDAEGLSNAIEAEVVARLDEKQRRIAKALENGVEPDDIGNFEHTLNYISSIRDADISDESDKGEALRYRLIYQDYLNKGYSKERADKYTRRSIDSGNDVEDAREALQSNKEYFQKKYDTLLEEAQKEADAQKALREKETAAIKKSLLEDKNLLGDIELSNDIRKKALEAISRPVYKNPETGDYMTALQKYETEHRSDLLKYMGLFMALTNGFKDFDSFTKGKVKKEVRKGMRDLEQILTGSKKNTSGNLQMVSSVDDDSNYFINKGFKLSL